MGWGGSYRAMDSPSIYGDLYGVKGGSYRVVDPPPIEISMRCGGGLIGLWTPSPQCMGSPMGCGGDL